MPEQPPQKRVVKKVVKRPATRPGTPVATGTSTKPRPAAKAASAAKRGGVTARRPVAQPARPPRPSLATRLAPVRSGATQGVKRVGGTLGSGAANLRDIAIIRTEQVRGWRVPHLAPTRGAAVTGLLAGLLTTLLGWLAMLGFSAVRGVSTGGGFWGSITIAVLVAVVAFLAGRLLRAMAIGHPGTIVLFGLATSVVIVLAFFLSPVSGPWAWLILPATATVSFVVAERLVALAERPTEA